MAVMEHSDGGQQSINLWEPQAPQIGQLISFDKLHPSSNTSRVPNHLGSFFYSMFLIPLVSFVSFGTTKCGKWSNK